MKRWHKDLLILFLFLVLGTSVYGNSLSNPFQFDDEDVVVYNRNIQTLKNIPEFFTRPDVLSADPRNSGHYRPLVVLSYAINYAVGGLSPFGYHLVNLAFHVGSAFVLFLVVKAMLGSMGHGSEDTRRDILIPPFIAAVAAGMIFLVHPFNSEAVNYTTARSSVMSGFFYLLAFYCWVKYRSSADLHGRLIVGDEPPRYIYYLCSLLAFVAGILSKEVVVTLPLVLWLYDLYFGGRRLKPAATYANTFRTILHWRTYLPYLPFILIVIIPYLLVRMFSFGSVLSPFQRSLQIQLFTELPVLARHWQMFIFPSGLSLVHDADIYRNITWQVFFSAFLLSLYIGAAVYFLFFKQGVWRIVSFFLIWFFVVLLPTTIIPLNAIFQENRGYLAMVSFSVLLSLVLGNLNRKSFSVSMIGITIVLIGLYSAVTVRRNTIWQDDVRLWKDAVEKAPHSIFAYSGLAAAYRKKGDLFLAVETAKKGVSLAPNDYNIHINLGKNYQIMGNIDQAIYEYEQALRINPAQVDIWGELAIFYSKKGDLERAENYLKEVVKLWDDIAPLHYNLGITYMRRGKLLDAVKEFQRAVSIYPRYLRARYQLALVFESLGRYDEAYKQYREIIQYSSSEYDPRVFLFFKDDKEIEEKVVKLSRQRLENRNRPNGQNRQD